LELERANKKIGSSLQAAPVVYAAPEWSDGIDGVDLAEVSITSDISVRPFAESAAASETFSLPDVPGVAVKVVSASGHKCARCWRVLVEVKEEGGICRRCADAVAALPKVPV
jgi:isoleucyl-tRNA synthetase